MWRSPDDLKVEINVGSRGKAEVLYNSPKGEIMRVECSASNLGEDFFDYVVRDETGLYINPTEERMSLAFSGLEDFVAKSAVEHVNRGLDRNRLSGGLYENMAKVSKNLFRRAGKDFDDEGLLRVYDEAWNGELERVLPSVLDDMKEKFAGALAGRETYWGVGEYSSTKVSKIYNAIVRDKINVTEGVKKDFAEVVVLNNMYKKKLEDDRIRAVQSSAKNLKRDIERKQYELEQKIHELPELRKKVKEAKINITRDRDSDLRNLGIEDVVGFSGKVKPVNLAPLLICEIDDDIPF